MQSDPFGWGKIIGPMAVAIVLAIIILALKGTLG